MTKEEARDKLKKELQNEFVIRWGANGYDCSSGDFSARAIR